MLGIPKAAAMPVYKYYYSHLVRRRTHLQTRNSSKPQPPHRRSLSALLSLLMILLRELDSIKPFERLSCILERFPRFLNILAPRVGSISGSSIHYCVALSLRLRRFSQLPSSISLRPQARRFKIMP